MPAAESVPPVASVDAAAPAGAKPRHGTLFRRLVVAQALAALALLLFTLLFYVDRQLTVAQLLADRWAPVLRTLDAGDGSAPAIGPSGLPLRSVRELPPDTIEPRWLGPRLRLLAAALQRQGGPVLLDVIDQVPGLPAGRETEVLQAFARGDASRGAPGTGLGLAVVQRIVTRMGGTLSFEQGVEGHRVRVRWPGVKPGR